MAQRGERYFAHFPIPARIGPSRLTMQKKSQDSSKEDSSSNHSSTVPSVEHPVSLNQATVEDEDVEQLNPLTRADTRQIDRRILEANAKDKEGTNFLETIRKLWAQCRPAWFLDHLDIKSLKIAFRVFLHFFLTFLLLACRQSREYMGSVGYLMCILAAMDTCGGLSLTTAVLTSLFGLVSASFGFMCYSIASAIKWAVHGHLTQTEVASRIIANGECSIGDSNCIQEALLDGRYVDVRGDAVTIFGYLCGLAILSFVGSQSLLLKIPFIVGMIFVTISFLNTNHIPWFDPWSIGRLMYIPFGFHWVIKIGLSMIIFPVSSNRKIMNTSYGALASLAKSSKEMFAHERSVTPSEPGFSLLLEKFIPAFQAPMRGLLAVFQDLAALKFELSYSRFDATDVMEYLTFFRLLSSLLCNFSFVYEDCSDRSKGTSSWRARTNTATSESPSLTRYQTFDYSAHKSRFKWLKNELNKKYKQTGQFSEGPTNTLHRVSTNLLNSRHLDDIFMAIVKHYTPLIDAINDTIDEILLWIEEANKFRLAEVLWPPSRKKRILAQKNRHFALLEAYERLTRVYKDLPLDWIHDRADGLSEADKVYITSKDVLYGACVKELTRVALRMCRWSLYLDQTRPHPQIIFPLSSPKAGAKRLAVMNTFTSEDSERMDFDPSSERKEYTPYKARHDRNPDSSPPRNIWHLFGSAFVKFKKTVWNDVGKFAWRQAASGLIPAVLYLNRHTLRWAYGYKLVWVVIMTTMSTTPRTGDSVQGLVIRVAFTFIGGVLGMVCWYISSGHGKGNPYGFAVTMAAASVVMAYFRMFSTIGGPGARIIGCITVILVTGISFMDNAYPTPGTSLSIGFEIAWIRFVTVVVGVTIGFLATIFPHASTTRKAIRMQIAKCLRLLGELHSDLVNFGLQRQDDPAIHQGLSQDVIIQRIGDIRKCIIFININMDSVKFEPALTGKWPEHHYQLLVKLLKEQMWLYSLFYSILNYFEKPDQIIELFHFMGLMDHDLLAGTYATIYMSSNALITAQPLPTIVPSNIAAVYVDLLKHLMKSGDNDVDVYEAVHTMSTTRSGRVMVSSTGIAELIYRRYDGILSLAKRLVGEFYGIDPRIRDMDLADGDKDHLDAH